MKHTILSAILLALALILAPACDSLEEVDLGDEPAPTYVQPAYSVDATNAIVTDTTSNGIMWQKCAYGETEPACAGDPGLQTYSFAVDYCENATSGGYKDWRLPTVNELLTFTYDGIADYTWFDNYDDLKDNFWLSSTFETSVKVYTVKFVDAEKLSSTTITSGSTYYIRCARSIQP